MSIYNLSAVLIQIFLVVTKSVLFQWRLRQDRQNMEQMLRSEGGRSARPRRRRQRRRLQPRQRPHAGECERRRQSTSVAFETTHQKSEKIRTREQAEKLSFLIVLTLTACSVIMSACPLLSSSSQYDERR